MSDKPRILMLYTRFPYPPMFGDRMHVYHYARELGEDYDVDLLCLASEEQREQTDALKSVFRQVFCFPLDRKQLLTQAILGMAKSNLKLPAQVAGFRNGEVKKWLRQNASSYDLLYFHHVRSVEWHEDISVPAVLDYHDAISLNYKGVLGAVRGPWRLFYQWEQPRLLEYELDCLNRFSHSFICSPTDRDYLLREYQARAGESRLSSISVMPMGVRDELVESNPCAQDEPWIVYLGKMNYLPNEDAVAYFAREVFPLVQAQIGSQARFVIVGAQPSRRVQELAELPGVTVTGFVDDPNEYLSKARVVVAPLRIGAGIQNKVLESMALGKAVAASSLAASGIEGVAHGGHLLIADDPHDMASAVVSLWDSKALREELGHQARELIRSRYTWSEVGIQLRARIADIFSPVEV
ncbi:MAG: glycosyltransferase [Chloroflexi bacterium]|nr:glycosyltransferase [Chloroflexota bacterium]